MASCLSYQREEPEEISAPTKNQLQAALYIRYRGKAKSIKVDGKDTPLIKLGHNAAEKNGWHPYVLEVEAKETYELEFEGQISLINQCVRVVVAASGIV